MAKQIQDVIVQDKRQCLYGWIEIKKRCSPNDNLHMVGIKVVRKRNIDDIGLTGDVLGLCSLSSCSFCFVMFLSHKNIFQMFIPPVVKPDPHMKFLFFFLVNSTAVQK